MTNKLQKNPFHFTPAIMFMVFGIIAMLLISGCARLENDDNANAPTTPSKDGTQQAPTAAEGGSKVPANTIEAQNGAIEASSPIGDPFDYDGLVAKFNDQRVTPLAVIEQISGNNLRAKVQLVDQSNIPKVNEADSSKPLNLNTYVKTVDISIDQNTRFLGLSKEDIQVGKGYSIVVDKSFTEGTNLVAISIAASSMPPDKISQPALIAPPLFQK